MHLRCCTYRHMTAYSVLCLLFLADPADCPAGTFGLACNICVDGSYCLGGREAEIIPCGENRFSAPGAQSSSQCFCTEGVCVCVYVLRLLLAAICQRGSLCLFTAF